MKQVSSRRDSNRGAISSWLFIGMMLWIDVGSMLSSVLGLPLAVTSAGVLLLLAGLLVFYSQTPRSPDQAWSPRLLRGIKFLIAFYFVLNYVPLNRSGVAVSLAQREVLLGGGCALFWLAARERRTWPFVLCAALFGTLLRIVSYHTITLSTGGDMLPLVSAALQKFESGKSPYTTLYVPWPLPLTYPPLSFIPYLPFHYLGIDIRVTNLLAGLLLLGPILLIATAGQKRPALERISIILTEDFCRDASSARRDEGAGFWPVTEEQRGEAREALPSEGRSPQIDAPRLGKKPTEGLLRCALEDPPIAISALLWCLSFLGPSCVWWSLTNTHAIFWLLLALLFALTVRDHLRAAAVVAGLGLASSLMMNVALPFFVLTWVRRRGFLRAAGLSALTLAVALLLILPFFIWAPRDFVLGVWRWHTDPGLAPKAPWLAERLWEHQIGFSGIFWRLGRQGWLKPIQSVVIALLLLKYFRRGAPMQNLGAYLCLAYALFMTFNHMQWNYLFWPVALTALLQAALAGAEKSALPSDA